MPAHDNLVSHVAYGVLMGLQETIPFYAKVGRKLPRNVIKRYMEYPHQYDATDPLYGVEPDEILNVFAEYVREKYPLLGVASFPTVNVDKGDFSGYVFFVSSTFRLFEGIDSIDFADISSEEEYQLNKFIRKFLPVKTDGWKVWSSSET